jgi:NDP-sugar pyrophosphorylase family protein
MRPSELFACTIENDFQGWLARFASVEELFSSRDQLYAKLHQSQIDGAVEEQVTIEGPVHISPGSRVRSGAVLIGPLVIGPNCNVDHGARVFRRTFIGLVLGFAQEHSSPTALS